MVTKVLTVNPSLLYFLSSPILLSLLFLAILLFRFPFISKSCYCWIPFFAITTDPCSTTPLIAQFCQCYESIIFVLYVMVHRLNMLILVAVELYFLPFKITGLSWKRYDVQKVVELHQKFGIFKSNSSKIFV